MRNLNNAEYADRILTHYIVVALRSAGETVGRGNYVEKMKAALGVTS